MECIMNHLMKLIQINHSFQKSVNLQLDLDNYERIGGYIPTRSSMEILRRFWNIVSGKSGECASVLIGPYGKGKSHLLLVLLALLRGGEEQNTMILKKIGKIDSELEDEICEWMDRGKKYLPVLIQSVSGTDLNQSFIYALQEALNREELEELVPNDYYSEAVKVIGNWEKEYPDTYATFAKMAEQKGFEIEEFCKSLKKQERSSLDFFMESYPKLTAGSRFQPIMQLDAVRIYQQVNRILVEENGYAGMFLVFDEFSKYLEGHGIEHFSGDMKTLQDMCELVNASKGQMIFTMVAHKSIHDYGKTIDKSVKNAFRGVEGRIREIDFVVSAQNNYELIADTIGKKEPEFSKNYGIWNTQSVYGEILEKTYHLSVFQKLFQENEYLETMGKGCYPLLPLTAYALLGISEKVAQNERTIFTFLAEKEQGSLSWLLQKTKEEFIGTDRIYDYFKNLFRDNADLPQIHNEWMKAEYAISKVTDELEIKILKTIAIIRMIHKEEELPAKEEIFWLSLGCKKAEFAKAMQQLVDKKLIVYRQSLGVYAFRSNVGVDIEKAIANRMGELENRINVCKSLMDIAELDYELPKRYNQEFAITRYFQYEILLFSDFLKMQNSDYLFEEKFSDGKILILLHEDDVDIVQAQQHLQELTDDRLIALVSKNNLSVCDLVLKYEAVNSLKKDEKFIEDNIVLLQELNLYEEDISFEINSALEQDFLPESKNVYVLGEKGAVVTCQTAAAWNNYLSGVCERYYGHSPKVNHELLNIECIGAQYKKARNQVIRNILDENDCTGYLKGTSPEAMVYRAAFVHTKNDIGCNQVCSEIEKFFDRCAGEKNSFGDLYECLQGKDYGARKGIIPLFLAKKLADTEGTAVIYLKNKELEVSFETLNHVNEFPDKYELYIEPETAAKDWYLKELEQIFCDKGDFTLSKQSRINGIVACMQKWYRSLPQYAVVTEQYSVQNFPMVKILRSLLKRAEINPRELIFDRIPQGMESDDYKEVISNVKNAVSEMNGKLEELLARVNVQIKKEFRVEKNTNLKACLIDWYEKQSQASKQYLLSTRINKFMSYLEQLTTNDEEKIVQKIIRIVLDVYVEDWNDASAEQFERELHEMRVEVENIQDTSAESDSKSKFILEDADGNEIMKYFDAEITDSTSIYLQNMIEEALDDFGDTLEMNQKVAVLVQAIRKLL